ncbi:phasin family protein [Halomonas denitrificans]|uniref:phasin family protein n=1 Tax=Halomonas TaxID=2745 RepID=UPI001A903C22|nr:MULTISPECIES: phasin family protein [Halomonas]MED5294124.1 phasin family protein [Pseudomonadota bacterium]MBN8414294.1 phasin family protein [Halomonas litopenaei]MBY5927014.1 phasin family protein [Halomonas sp. DP4Y7-2]MBY5930989.1 phasin family protein [Halomonas sp. DP8Y7-3]MBY5968892.1 phasin family protein [Halomonas denitrificans]
MRTFDAKALFNNEQVETLFFGPARAYANLTVDFAEKLASAQLDAAKAYAETGLAQARAFTSVKDAEGLRSYMEGQQKVAKDLTERMKGDAEKVVALQQDFVSKSQKLAEDNVKAATDTATKATANAK